MGNLIHIADRVLNTPLLVTREKAQIILSVLAGRIGVNSPEASRFEGSSIERDETGMPVGSKPYNLSNGVAIITITGSLVNRGAWIGASSGLTSYEGIQHQLKTALADADVHSAILDIHSPGGEAVGAFETAEIVRQLSSEKRTVAIANGLMASAAYAIGSGADEIVTTQTGVTGSIGVVLLHADFSRALDQDGITPTLIFAGDHKVDGNPFEPLGDEVRTDMQAQVNAFYDLFVKTVSIGRGGRFSESQARATQARTYIGQQALAAGTADRVASFETVLEELSRVPANRQGRTTPSFMKGRTMSENKGAPAAEENAGISQEDHDKAVASATETGKQAGVKAEQERVAGLVSMLGKGHDDTVKAMIADGKSTKAEAAIAIVEATEAPAAEAGQQLSTEKVLQKMDLAADGVRSVQSETGTSGDGKPAASTPDGWKAEWEGSEKLQAEYPTAESYVATRKRDARKAA